MTAAPASGAIRRARLGVDPQHRASPGRPTSSRGHRRPAPPARADDQPAARGLLHGDHLGLLPGHGSERAESREYRLGDDVRRMDWAVTARTSVPHVSDLIADRELTTYAVVDLTPSMHFGTHTWEKRDLALAATTAFGVLTTRLGSPLRARRSCRAPARAPASPNCRRGAGAIRLRHALRVLAAAPRAEPRQPLPRRVGDPAPEHRAGTARPARSAARARGRRLRPARRSADAGRARCAR